MREVATWFVRIVLGTVALGLCQVFGLLFAVGAMWVGAVFDAADELWQRIRWGKR